MVFILLALIAIGDIYLYIKGVRPKNSMWRDEVFTNKYRW